MATRLDLRKRTQYLADLTGADVSLEEWSPGDGWTRYRVNVTTQYGQENVSHYLKLAEMDEYLNGAINALEPSKYNLFVRSAQFVRENTISHA